jgi:hypothetical protein
MYKPIKSHMNARTIVSVWPAAAHAHLSCNATLQEAAAHVIDVPVMIAAK